MPIRLNCTVFLMGPCLFIAQRDGRVDFCCATGRDVTSQNSGSRQNQRDAAEDERVVSADSKEEAGQDARRGESNQRAEYQPNDCQPHALADHESQYTTALRTHRHTNANLTRLLVHRIREDAVDTHHRKK